jgi:hypothetical protein
MLLSVGTLVLRSKISLPSNLVTLRSLHLHMICTGNKWNVHSEEKAASKSLQNHIFLRRRER